MYTVLFGDGEFATTRGYEIIDASSAKARRAAADVLNRDAIVPVYPADGDDPDGQLIEEADATFKVGAKAHIYAALSTLPDAIVTYEDAAAEAIIDAGIIEI